ncbi:hypothetical protein HBZC1_17390 [Helicobacter bizzozeronii CIII-1]|uniref:Uncharacterized protein n=1 Tax=Helicobacter bizzozeronii (strain CIII-1) TaxID=1002804 RepID=F8KPK1_HELBC|nr:hypothetical protein HBZC1_17390 [Helicobacter bizzozeronii CIII-1]
MFPIAKKAKTLWCGRLERHKRHLEPISIHFSSLKPQKK